MILPYHGIGAFIRHIHPEYRTLDAAQYPTDEQVNGVGFQTVETQYTVYNGDDINQIAKMFKCKPENIKVWNNLTSNYL